MKKILIAGYPELTHNYESAINTLGATPITTLNVPDPDAFDGLILPGGGDIDPKLFGQLNHGSRVIDAALDRIQLAILKCFARNGKPVLGICKGMQLINIFFGGNIIQHLPTYESHQYDDHDKVHQTTASDGSLLCRLYGRTFPVNSAHHQGVDTPGRNILYTQICNDGVIEGLAHTYLPIIGVQWHPERMCFTHQRTDTVDGSLLLSHFLTMT